MWFLMTAKKCQWHGCIVCGRAPEMLRGVRGWKPWQSVKLDRSMLHPNEESSSYSKRACGSCDSLIVDTGDRWSAGNRSWSWRISSMRVKARPGDRRRRRARGDGATVLPYDSSHAGLLEDPRPWHLRAPKRPIPVINFEFFWRARRRRRRRQAMPQAARSLEYGGGSLINYRV